MRKLILGIAAVGMFTFASAQEFDKAKYIKEETAKRAKKDNAYKTGHHSNKDAHGHSPLSTEQKAKFKGLSYYDINPDYRVEVDFVEFKNPDHYALMLTDGKMHHYWVVGKVMFKMNGEDCELFVYQDKKFAKHHAEYKEYMFIPFRDKTNGTETYAGGRYLQWHDPHGNHDLIDFNDAFNPASVYNPVIADPVVPYINTLPVKVEAGEKDF